MALAQTLEHANNVLAGARVKQLAAHEDLVVAEHVLANETNKIILNDLEYAELKNEPTRKAYLSQTLNRYQLKVIEAEVQLKRENTALALALDNMTYVKYLIKINLGSLE